MNTWRALTRFDASKVEPTWLLLAAACVTIGLLVLACWLSEPANAARWL